MIGNGFDRALGMKSRFCDTYESYIASPSADDVITQFKHVLEKDIEKWSDFEMRMAYYAKNFSSEKDFVQCVRDYTRFLNTYLKKEEDSVFSAIEKENLTVVLANEMIKLLSSFHLGLIRNNYNRIDRILASSIPNHITFITFNYTNSLEKINTLIKSDTPDIASFSRPTVVDKIIHIHGQLDNDVTLGVDNETQFNELPYKLSTRGKRVFIKPFFNGQYDSQRVSDAERAIERSDIICTFGWSLGDSDQTWRSKVLEWLLNDRHRHLIILNHKLLSKQYPVCSITEQMDDAEEYRDNVLGKIVGNISPEDYEELASRVYVPTGYSLLNLEESVPGYKNLIEQDRLDPPSDEDIKKLLGIVRVS